MLRLFKINNGLISEKTVLADPIPLRLETADWIDAQDPSEEERQQLSTLLRSDVPESDDVEEIEASARCFVDQSGIHVHSLFLTQEEGRYNTVSVACILQNERLITVREGEVADFRLMRMRARRGQVESNSPTQLLVTLFEQKVENHADALEDIHRKLEGVSHMVLENEEADLEDAISQLAELEDSNGKIRLCLMDTQRNISFLVRHLREQVGAMENLREIMRDVETLMSHTTFLFDKINFLMDSTQGFINIEQNQIIKTFSIAAVIFLPPTVVASLYGMNFEFMPHIHWRYGFELGLCLMIASALAPFWYFKSKDWL